MIQLGTFAYSVKIYRVTSEQVHQYTCEIGLKQCKPDSRVSRTCDSYCYVAAVKLAHKFRGRITSRNGKAVLLLSPLCSCIRVPESAKEATHYTSKRLYGVTTRIVTNEACASRHDIISEAYAQCRTIDEWAHLYPAASGVLRCSFREPLSLVLRLAV